MTEVEGLGLLDVRPRIFPHKVLGWPPRGEGPGVPGYDPPRPGSPAVTPPGGAPAARATDRVSGTMARPAGRRRPARGLPSETLGLAPSAHASGRTRAPLDLLAISSNDTSTSMRCSTWLRHGCRRPALLARASAMRPPHSMMTRGYIITGGPLESPRTPKLLGDAADVHVAPGRLAAGSDPDWDACRTVSRSPPTDLATGGKRPTSRRRSEARSPVPVDCLGTWLTAIMDGECRSAATADRFAAVPRRHRLDGQRRADRIAHCDRGDERGRPRGGAIPFFGRCLRSTGAQSTDAAAARDEAHSPPDVCSPAPVGRADRRPRDLNAARTPIHWRTETRGSRGTSHRRLRKSLQDRRLQPWRDLRDHRRCRGHHRSTENGSTFDRRALSRRRAGTVPP